MLTLYLTVSSEILRKMLSLSLLFTSIEWEKGPPDSTVGRVLDRGAIEPNQGSMSDIPYNPLGTARS